MNSAQPLVWMIPKWYPHKEDLQFGVFIQKHAQSIALYTDIAVLYIASQENISSQKIEVSKNGRLTEVSVFYPRKKGLGGKIQNLFLYLKAASAGEKELLKIGKPAVIQAYILLRTGILARKLSRKYRAPYIVSEQWSGYATGKFNLKNPFIKYLTKKIISEGAALTVVSDFLKKSMQHCGLFHSRTVICRNVVDIPKVTDKKEISQVIRVLIVADLVDEIKNISGVIHMISSLPDDVPKFKLTIIGRGKDEQMLKELSRKLRTEDRIFFAGFKVNHEVYEYLMQSDFLLLNSNFETFSSICAEALSCGKPVLATRCGGPQEFIHPEHGTLIEPGNEEQLRIAFIDMLNNYRFFNPETLRDYTAESFSKEGVGNIFYKLYAHIASESAN